MIGYAHIEAMEYTEKMPMLPGLSIGLIPIAQMFFFPPVIFPIVAVLGSRKYGNVEVINFILDVSCLIVS